MNEYYIFTLQTTNSEINTWHVNHSTCWNVNYLRSWNLNTLDLIEQISADRSGIRVNCCCPKGWSVSFSLSIASLHALLQRIAVWSLIPGNKVNINQELISADIREQRNTWFTYGSAMPWEPVFIWNKTFRMPYKKVSYFSSKQLCLSHLFRCLPMSWVGRKFIFAGQVPLHFKAMGSVTSFLRTRLVVKWCPAVLWPHSL